MHIIAKRLRLSEAKEVVIGQRMDSRSSSTLINPGEGPGLPAAGRDEGFAGRGEIYSPIWCTMSRRLCCAIYFIPNGTPFQKRLVCYQYLIPTGSYFGNLKVKFDSKLLLGLIEYFTLVIGHFTFPKKCSVKYEMIIF